MAQSGACWPAALMSTEDGPVMTSPGSRPGRPAYPQPTPVPGSSATSTSSAEPPSGAGPEQSTTIARAPGSPPQARPVTLQPAGTGSGTQAGTWASAVTAAIASCAITTVWCSGVTWPCRWHHARAVLPGRTTKSSPHRGHTGVALIAGYRPVSRRIRQAPRGTAPRRFGPQPVCVACRACRPTRSLRCPSCRASGRSCTTRRADCCSSAEVTTPGAACGRCPEAASRPPRPSPRPSSARSAKRPGWSSARAPPSAASGSPAPASCSTSSTSPAPSTRRTSSRYQGTTPTPCCSPTPPPCRHCLARRGCSRPCAAGAWCCRSDLPRCTPGSAGGRLRPRRLLPAAGLAVRALGHHHLSPEDADHRAVLLAADGLDVHDPAVVLGLRLGLVEHRRLAVDRVAVERRRHVPQRLDLQVGDRLAGDIGNAHPEQQRVDVVADHDVLAE